MCIAMALNGANLYGYVKCKMGGDKNITAATSDFLRKQVIQNVSCTQNIIKFNLFKIKYFKDDLYN